jgi:hypothetical protein
MSNLRDFTGKNRKFTGTEGIIIPAGTSAQRPGSPTLGTLRYNTDAEKGFLEQYNAAGWGAIDAPPEVTSVSPTDFDGNAGGSFTVTGSNFKNNSTIDLILADGSVQTPATITFNSATSISFTTSADITVAQSPVDIKVNNPSGLSSTLSDAFDAGNAPTFSSPANLTNLGTLYGAGSTISSGDLTQIVGTDLEDSSTVTFSMDANIGDSSNLSISNGYVVGTAPNPSSTTTYTFTVTLTDSATNSSTRQFRLTIDTSYTPGGNYIGDGGDG